MAALNFTQFIAQNTPGLTNAQRTAMLDKFCANHGYKSILENGSPNPISKSEFFNRYIGEIIIRGIEEEDSTSAATSATASAVTSVRAAYWSSLVGS